MKSTWRLAIALGSFLAWSLGACTVTAATGNAGAVLRATILDAATGRPAACNVALTDSQGRLVVESASYKSGFRCDGRFEKSLPAGHTRLRVTRGPETRAVERVLQLAPGATNEVQIELERVVDLRKRGWFSGDSHAHMIHGERTIPVTFDDVALAARAEDLQYLSLAQAWSMEEATPEKLEVELGRRSRPDCVLNWNLEAPKNYYRGDAGRCLGHCWTLGLRGRTEAGGDVIELLMDASAHDYQSAKKVFANFESHALIHAQGGATFYSHPLRWWMGAWGGQGGYPKVEEMRVSNMAVELPLDTLIGPTYDGIDVITSGGEFKGFELWALLLNHGYRLAAVASSDACFDRPGGAVPGTARTYTQLEGEFSMESVTRATAQGKTFATTGPLILASVDGQAPGAIFPADGKPRVLSLAAWGEASDTNGLRAVEVLRNGVAIQEYHFAPAIPDWSTNLTLRVQESAWFCVRVRAGVADRERGITGAFYFEAPGSKPPAPVLARVRVRIKDAATGQSLSGDLVEVAYQGTLGRDERKHAFAGEGTITMPGTRRLRAEVPGYVPQTLSPFLDNPAMVETVTRLEEKDLTDWRTYERLREMLGDVHLTFSLEKSDRCALAHDTIPGGCAGWFCLARGVRGAVATFLNRAGDPIAPGLRGPAAGLLAPAVVVLEQYGQVTIEGVKDQMRRARDRSRYGGFGILPFGKEFSPAVSQRRLFRGVWSCPGAGQGARAQAVPLR